MAQPKDHDDHEDDCTQTQALQQSKYIGLNPHGVYLKKAYAKSEMSGSGPKGGLSTAVKGTLVSVP